MLILGKSHESPYHSDLEFSQKCAEAVLSQHNVEAIEIQATRMATNAKVI